jgi:hypothetical protein
VDTDCTDCGYIKNIKQDLSESAQDAGYVPNSKKNMNFQDFACAVSDLVWGGELAWARDGIGLFGLLQELKSRLKQGT